MSSIQAISSAEPRLVRDNMLEIPKSFIRDVEGFKAALTFANGAYFAAQRMGHDSNLPSHYILYEEHETCFLAPRNFTAVVKDMSWSTYPFHTLPAEVVPGKARGVPYRHWRHRLTPRPRQAPAIAYLEDGDDKILCLSCGAGKTCVALAALCQQASVRLPALIVVHTQELMEQWEQRIRQHVCMGPVRVGRVQGPTCDYRLPFTLAMLQTLSKKTYPDAFYRHFKTVLYDEAHRLGAPLFSRVAGKFTGQRWGLSATPDRSDGNEVIFRAHLGKVGYVDLKQDLEATTFFVETPCVYDMRQFRMWGKPHLHNNGKLLTVMSEDSERNDLILTYVHRLAKQGRTILVLGERVEQLTELAARCEYQSAPLAGPIKKEERSAALQQQVVFATAKRAKEGLDRDAFDTLIFLTPVTDPANLQQSYGRILRTREGKLDPYVLVFEDLDVPPMFRRCQKMRAWLYRNKFSFKKVHLGQ